MVDTLADWMLRYPALFYTLDMIAAYGGCVVVTALCVYMAALPPACRPIVPQSLPERICWQTACGLMAFSFVDYIASVTFYRHILSPIEQAATLAALPLFGIAQIPDVVRKRKARKDRPPPE